MNRLVIIALLVGFATLGCSGDVPSGAVTGTPTATGIPTSTPIGTPRATEVPSTPAPTVSPTPEVRQWTLGAPVPLPDGLTLVLGTGCWRCGGQYSTYVAFDSSGVRTLYEAEDQTHIAGYFEDPTRILLAACQGDCNTYDQVPSTDDVLTTLYESTDRGMTWEVIDQFAGMYLIVGAVASEQLAIIRYVPQPTTAELFPSRAPLVPPEGVNSGDWLWIHHGEPVWMTPGGSLATSDGLPVLDFVPLLPEGAVPYQYVENVAGDWFILWIRERTWGSTLVRAGGVEHYVGRVLAEADVTWLDDRYLIASIEYTAEQLEILGADPVRRGSRTPTLVDTVTLTLHPFDELLAAAAPWGRNEILAIWRD